MVHTSSAVVLGALALNAANALATPVHNPIDTDFQARDVNENQLEERKIGSFLTKAAPFLPFLTMIPGLGGQQRREIIDEIEARGISDKLTKFAPWAPLIPVALDFLKPKQQPQQQQQAPPPPPPQRREIEEYLGRELSDVEARGLGKFFSKAAPFLPFVSMIPGLNGQQRRDLDGGEGLEERGFRNTFSKIAPWAPLIPIGLDLLKGGSQQQAPPPPPQRRDIEEMLGRELSDVEARGLDQILDTVSQVAPWLPMIGGMLPDRKPTVPPKPAALRGKPKREVSEQDGELDARGFRNGFEKVAPWGPVIAIGADLIKQKLSPPPPPPSAPVAPGMPGTPDMPAVPPQVREVDESDALETRSPKGGRGGGFGGALKKVGNGLEKAAPWVPLAAVGADMLLNQQARDVEDSELETRSPKGGRGGGFGGALKKVGGAVEKAAPWAPLAAIGADMLLNQQARDVDDYQLESRSPKGGRGGGFGGALKKVGGGLEKAAPWLPLAAVGADMLLNQQARELNEELYARDFEEDLDARDYDDELDTRELEELLGRELTDIEARGFRNTLSKVAPWAPLLATGLSLLPSGQQPPQRREVDEIMDSIEARGFRTTLSKVGPWAPLIATGLSLLPTGQQRREVAEEIMDIFHRELSSLEDLD